MLWDTSNLLCIFTSLIHTRIFSPPPPIPPHPHLSYITSVSCVGPQAASLPSFHSFFSPVWILPKSPMASQAEHSCFLLFLLPLVSCAFETDSGARKNKKKNTSAHSCQSCILPWGLYRELLSSFFKSTHPLTNACTTATHTHLIEMGSLWKMPIFLMDWIWKPSTPPEHQSVSVSPQSLSLTTWLVIN